MIPSTPIDSPSPNLAIKLAAGPKPSRTQGDAGRFLYAVTLLWSCTGTISPTLTYDAQGSPAESPAPNAEKAGSELAQEVAEYSESGDALRGGRLYDEFYGENPEFAFVPDDPETPALDGRGGPSGNGTLPNSRGSTLSNALDHGYRIKSFFGWDLRGADGVYGPEYHDKPYVAAYNLLDDPLTREQIARLLVDGAADVPAYGQIMPEEDLSDLVAFVLAVRAHELPRPSDIWDLDRSAPNGYVLRAGANVAAGRAAIRSSCGTCHGADGAKMLFDDGEFSLGTLARSGAYEVWFKIVAGNPGSPMGSQVPSNESWSTQSQMVLDVLAALCDRSAFPAGGASEPDVAANDPGCGSYLR